MQRSQRRNTETRGGAAAVELGVMLPLLAFVLIITVDFARVFYFSQIVTNCARSGAIYGSDPVAAAQSPYTSIQQAALATAGNLSPQPTVTWTYGADAAKNSYVRVTVAWSFHTITVFPGVPNTVNLNRTVQMRLAR